MAKKPTVHLLDVGPQEYSDALLCEFGDHTILIDGAHPANWKAFGDHPALQDQLAQLLGQQPTKLHVSLIIVSHAHDDHIGCLPKLIEKGWLTTDFAFLTDPDLGFGRSPEDAAPDAGILDPRARQVVAAMREEPRSPRTSTEELEQFLSDAVGLEQNYRDMIATLKATEGTTVLLYGRSASYKKLLDHFQDIGMEILGPRQAQLVTCAEAIRKGMGIATDHVTDALRTDVQSEAADVYRRMMGGGSGTDALDAGGRPGNFVNLQSNVVRFTVGGKKFLFGGDMQFIKPGTSDSVIATELKRMRKVIETGAPYAFVKLCHHGSWNAFDETFLTKDIAGTPVLGICAGSESESHPSKEALDVLRAHKNELTWLRTDRNGLSSFHFGQQLTYEKDHGKVNDLAAPGKKDEVVEVIPSLPPSSTTPSSVSTLSGGSLPQPSFGAPTPIEITAKIPYARTRVTITVDVEPMGPVLSKDVAVTSQPFQQAPIQVSGSDISPAVRQLLFVTSADRLGANIGGDAAVQIISALRATGAAVFDTVPPGDARVASAAVREELKRHPDPAIKGVVVLGAHDVVPSQRLDALPPSLRARIGENGDPDDFVVWNDETYGDRDDDLIPELPVSRIPDGRDARVILGTLRSSSNGPTGTGGLRNIQRPFADGVYERRLDPVGKKMMTSEPHEFDTTKLAGDRLYLMLHGDYSDGTRFWGEDTPRGREAINMSNLPEEARGVIFTGCCWGALTVDRPAGRWSAGQPIACRTSDTSIALTMLRRGANAFIGCTGAHYSPTTEPYDYFGGPMHDAFWRRVGEGASASQALFDAKKDYVKGMPHGQRTPMSAAIEFKIWRQYCCLGLGW